MLTLAEILEAPLRLLTEYHRLGEFRSPEHRAYAEILLRYLTADTTSLNSILSTLNDATEIKQIGTLRVQNLNHEEDQVQFSRVEAIARSESEFAGEAGFALGMSCFRFKRNVEAKEFFTLAYKKLEALGARQKAIKALLNAVVAESRIDNKRKLIRDYEMVAEKAAAVGATVCQGTCYQNICKELHSVGALEVALKYSNMAIQYLEEDAGTIHYFEAILQRCHILIDLGRYKEAYFDYDCAKISSHPQIIEASKAIEKILGAETEIEPRQLEPAWISKLNFVDSASARLTKTEMDFIDLIKSSRKAKDEVIQSLYGHEIDWESARNRFKVFLARFRKKYPNLIAEENGHYILVDESILSDIERVAQ